MLMWKPFLACLILTGMHVYLGLHVVERKVIFVDLALAQIAALGAVVAVLFHHDLRGPYGYMFSLTATFFGAVIFSLTRTRRERIPQEAVIGIVYAVSAALAILLLSRTAEGDEHIRQMLIGNILLVTPHEIIHMAVLYSLLGMAHWKFRDQFFRISTEPETAFQKGLSVRKWDLLFYVIFGVVVTSSVQIAGVLLVFSFLIIPAVAAMTFVRTIKNRLIFGWAMGTFTSMFGLMLSYRLDLPTGATIVCVFGGVLVLLSIWQTMFYHR
ncbi:MAG: ABC transporter [Candidatus Omnitrophica bacterium CG11_big_fil_rev_8_21_14_0_20_45_26]|uniref:ABC transporter n=1 Tax=Candidatus Abzuiibacterium crystallinum TaxID=1974748 RepID=A0A2H0LQ02_9BACT|nr:MAG: ABC transporter [Candidatus Omnitrophica bacterium CG11_big_fil_rev_8_21_14_0_20_45_26]PIW63624.1 MAG: metal ABC transporter permease [Candidatus Omnitrophica bacterium CG12_big_fil_rev_8_21_14_0_65_45_16]